MIMIMLQLQQPNTISVTMAWPILSLFFGLLFQCSVGGPISSSPLVLQYQEPPIHWNQLSPIRNIRKASTAVAKAVALKQTAQAQALHLKIAAAPVALSPPSSDNFGHYGIDKILCLGPIEDVVQRACAHVKKKGYKLRTYKIGERAVLCERR